MNNIRLLVTKYKGPEDKHSTLVVNKFQWSSMFKYFDSRLEILYRSGWCCFIPPCDFADSFEPEVHSLTPPLRSPLLFRVAYGRLLLFLCICSYDRVAFYVFFELPTHHPTWNTQLPILQSAPLAKSALQYVLLLIQWLIFFHKWPEVFRDLCDLVLLSTLLLIGLHDWVALKVPTVQH